MSLLGPVFHKELLELSRRRSTYYLRVIAGLGIFFAFFFFASGTGLTSTLSSGRRQAAIAANVFENWAWYQFWIVCGVTPLLTCGLIAAEREIGALPLLFTTHLTNGEIVLGKLASRLWTLFLLTFSALPVLVLLGLLGGIDLDRAFKIYVMTLAAAALAAAVGVYLSTTAKRPWVACVQTYALLAVLWAALPFGTAFGYLLYLQSIGPTAAGPNRDLLWLLLASCPYMPIYFLTETRSIVFGAPWVDWNHVWTYVSIWLCVAAAFLFAAVTAIRKDLKPSLFSRAILGSSRFLLRPFKSATVKHLKIESALFWRMRFSGFAVFERNPIVWRDRRADVYDPDGNVLRLQVFLWICAVPLGLLFAALPSGRGDLFGWLISLEIALLHVMLAVVGASSIARERQRGSLDVLLLSKTPSESIFFGTIQGVFWTCTPTLILVAATLALKVWTNPWIGRSGSPDVVIELVLLLTCYTCVVAVASVVISSAAVNSNHAIAAAVAVGLFHWFWPLPVGQGWHLLNFPLLASNGFYGPVLWTYVAILVGALALASRLLATSRPFPAAIIAVVVIPTALLFFTPTGSYGGGGTWFRGWFFSVQYGTANSRALFHHTENLVTNTGIAYALSIAGLLAFAVWNGDRLFGRMQSRQPPIAKPPLIGRNVSDAGANAPIPLSAPS